MPDETPHLSAKEYRQQAGSATSEREHQEQVIEWAEAKQSEWTELRLLHAIPNGQMRQGMPMEPGMKPGVPDLCLPVPTDYPGTFNKGLFHGLYIEMKRPGGRVREEQEDWLDALREQGYRSVVCYGADEAITAIEQYLGNDE